MKHEFKKLNALVHRNIKVYFKDKMLFFVSLITPMILIVLFLTFLGNVYQDTLLNFLPAGVTLPTSLIKGFTGGWLFSSIMSTSCITVAFCSNVLVNDKINHVINDFNITPVKKSTVQLSYFLANFFTTLIVCATAFVVGLVYLAIVGWYLSFSDVVMIFAVMILNTLFGTLLASIIEMFINSQGALSGVCTLVSSMYGFIAGAYMPISQFSPVIQNFVKFLPGTYSTVLFRQFFMNGTLNELENNYLPTEAVKEVRSSFDGSLTLFGTELPTWAMFLIIISAICVLLGIYFLITYCQNHRHAKVKLNNK